LSSVKVLKRSLERQNKNIFHTDNVCTLLKHTHTHTHTHAHTRTHTHTNVNVKDSFNKMTIKLDRSRLDYDDDDSAAEEAFPRIDSTSLRINIYKTLSKGLLS